VKVPGKYIFFLLLLGLIVALAVYLFFLIIDVNIKINDVLIPLIGFSVSSFIMVVIFHRGQDKDPQSQVFHTLVATGLKFLIDFILAIIWFGLAKKNSSTTVLIFFVLYLTLTLFSVMHVLKALKNKPL
jgi:hypothetical protein